MTKGQRVLVVDGLTETEEVLRAVLEPRGLQVDRIRGLRTSEAARKRPPSVVVMHVDDSPSAASTPEGWKNVPRIFIGAAEDGEDGRHADGAHYLSKPFQYGELIRTIERVLAKAG